MPEVDRRRFLQLTGGSAALSVLTPSIARAASIPADRRTGSIQDVEHIVILMQENRSFDHYFGTLQGVRGYGEPHPAELPNGSPVWRQPNGKKDVLPFRPDLDHLGLAFLQDIDHGWETGHDAFHDGRYDRWVPAKGTPVTMAHLQRHDIPFHYALADAFTVCDAYHCSMLGPTNPNRYYLWTGWVGNDGKHGGPAIDNLHNPPFTWTTYPERLQQAGVTWKIYQDIGTGLDAAGSYGWPFTAPYTGNFGDNPLVYFKKFQQATSGPLVDNGLTGTDVTTSTGDKLDFFSILADDVQHGRLPQVSWIAAPEAFSEHPNWPANFGAWYISKVLDALTSDPAVWAKTALFLTYDENDGFFDHVVPPYPSVGDLPGHSTVRTDHELYTGKAGQHGPYGLGVRVPMVVISPWSAGGWVCSEVFDHTSVIRFVEKRFGVHEPNITPWRRAVCGDLTSAFDFSATPAPAPSLPPTAAYQPPDDQRHPSVVPGPPAKQRMPKQEPGVRPSRAIGYRPNVKVSVHPHGLTVRMANHGRLGVHLQARSTTVKGAPFSYTLGSGHTLERTLAVTGPYDLSFHGPNGFFRRFSGTTSKPALDVHATREGTHLVVTLHNRTSGPLQAHVADAYGPDRTVKVRAHQDRTLRVPLAHTHGWYDLLVTVPQHGHFTRALAGRVETGRPSTTDPQLGR